MKYDFNFVRKLFAPIIAEPLSGNDETVLDDMREIVMIIEQMTEHERSDCDLLLDLERRKRIAHRLQIPIDRIDRVIRFRLALANQLPNMPLSD
jgi:hypothetical protein